MKYVGQLKFNIIDKYAKNSTDIVISEHKTQKLRKKLQKYAKNSNIIIIRKKIGFPIQICFPICNIDYVIEKQIERGLTHISEQKTQKI
jgi:hypothetical protein